MIRDFSAGDVMILLRAAQWTIVLSLVAFVGGTIIGLVIALMRSAAGRVPRLLAGAYVELFQGTPLLMQLFMLFFGANIVGLPVSAWHAAAIGLTLYSSAFLGEIWRGCIEAVPRGQWDAARALGLRYPHQVGLVIIPQALRLATPPTVGFLVQVIKSTSVTSILGFVELTRAAQLVNNTTFRPLLVFSIVCAIYFALCWPLSYLSRRLEGRLARADMRPPQAKPFDRDPLGIAQPR
ncbi:amino acid ABC transporter permease [Bosea sp. (in: a-proteobacteria)]|uniref:amino acid ABC transporter permease n=1 Tax=Bosea sp. (in: a-proteobacteria) TaxID=1871050 RepID=UPI00262FB798|nr:amino acid ABC transporter permease [Bosea sp. (in: a-proteobacteria)]MCO5093372.1 amino acid ABC transporter permease [Bosea sp. (in: a-proteobacteria)]